MDADFWNQRWANKQIAFHEKEANALLRAHFEKLSLPGGARVFLPLCGKTPAIAWLLKGGYRVMGVELVRGAVEQLFEELEVEPRISRAGNLECFHAPNIDIFTGDVFELSPDAAGPVHAIYDRAALVALPPETRERYSRHLTRITNAAPRLLIVYEYDQAGMPGPPFSITSEEIKRHCAGVYEPMLLESVDVPGGLKGTVEARENIWLLTEAR